MRPHDMPSVVDERLLVAVRKAALMVHWVPDLGVSLMQVGRPRVRVATWWPTARCVIDLHPCEFRQMVLRLMAGEPGLTSAAAGPAPLISMQHDDDLCIDYFTETGTAMGPHGMVRHQMTDQRAMYAFPTLLHPDQLPAAVETDHDDELGVSLVHKAFSVDGSSVEQETFEVMFDLATACAAEEVATLMGRRSP